MFSELFRKKVARFLVYVMLFCNVSPAFAMQIPEYNVRVQRQQVLDQVSGQMVSCFLVEAQKLVVQQAVEAIQTYQTIFSQVIFPFMAMTAMVQTGMANLYEILQRAKAEAQIFGTSDETTTTQEIETQISRGHCLSIPELGDLLITHDGDVIFGTEESIGKSLRISAPSQVILNNTIATDIDVEATAAILTGKAKSTINSLRFRGTGSAESLTNGLFIDKESELQVGNLSLENALLLNTGKLTVQQQLDLNGGYFFNTGALLTTADPSSFSNISYLFNGSSGSMEASGRLVIGVSNFSNLGSIRAQSMSVVTSTLFDNKGTMETVSGLELSGFGTVVNSGRINGQSGSISVSGTKFEHRSGEIRASKVDFGSDETILAGSVLGQEGFFHGSVTAVGNIHLQHGVIDGLFVNSSDATTFEQRLDLAGTRAEIQNRGKITTREIASDAVTGILDGGEILAGQAIIKKHLQIGSIMPQLTSVQTDAEASLLINEKSTAPKLKKIINAGKSRILTATPELEDLQNAQTGHLQLESSAPLTRITSLDHLKGRFDIKASLPNITGLKLQSGATLTVLEGSDFSILEDIRIQAGSTLLLEKSALFPALKSIYNFGTMTSKARLMGLYSIYNAPNADLHLCDRTRVISKMVSAEDMELVPAMATLPKGQIGVFNEGKILIKTQPTFFGGYYGLSTNGTYVGSQNSIIRLEDKGQIVANDFINDGIFYSPTKLTVLQTVDNVTKWGRLVSEDGIEYTIDIKPKGDTTTFKLSDTFKPIVNGERKTLKIKSTEGIEISRPINMNVDMEVEAPTFKLAENLTVKSFKSKTDTFTFEPSANPADKKTLSAKDFFDIQTRAFINTGGRLQTHGSAKSTLQVSGIFRNTGGGKLEKDKPETITWYTWNTASLATQTGTVYRNDPHESYGVWYHSRVGTATWHTWSGATLVPHTETVYRDIYSPELDKSGVITTGGILEIIAREFDNRFGIINAACQLSINSSGEVINECGLVYSGGSTTINGTLLKNGYMKGAKQFTSVDPNALIRENKTVPYEHFVDNYCVCYTSCGGGDCMWRCTCGCPPHYETRYRTDVITTGYNPIVQYSSASQYPGYIFSNGDLDINIDLPSYFGTIVSGGNVKIKGTTQESINFADRGTMVVRGNVNLELQKAALAQLAIQAQNIFMNLVQDLTIRGIVTPILMSNGSVSQLIDLQRLGQQLGFLIDESTFTEQGFSIISPTRFVPIRMSMPGASISGFSVQPTESSGFMGSIPDSRFFIPTVQDSILNQLIMLTLTPIYGRDILLNIDLSGQLRKTGEKIADTFRGSQTLMLTNGNPAILFDKSSNPDVEVEIDGQKVMVPLYNPFLLMDAVSRLINKIQAEKLLHIKSLGDIKLEPGKINLESENLTLESQKQIQIAAEYRYSDTGNRVGVTPVELSVPGTFIATGKEGIKTRGAQISAKKVEMTSVEGDVIDLEMPLDPTYTFWSNRHGDYGRVKQQSTFTSTFSGSDGMEFSAPKGTIDQHGTNITAGLDGIVFDTPIYTWQPAYEENSFYRYSFGGDFVSMDIRSPKVGVMQTPGSVIFKSKDSTLVGATIIAGMVSNPVDGRFRTVPAYMTQESHSLTIKNGFLGNSSLGIQQTRSTPVVTQIIANHFESLGAGVCELEGTVVKALDMTITKTLEERAAYEKIHTVITQKSSGFCAPKIKGDPFAEVLRGVPSAMVTFDGDTLPTAFNMIGTGAQTAAHALKLANMSKLGYNPMELIPQILLSRYVTGFTYSNTRTVTTMNESRPMQSRIETGVLRVNNDRTHLEGIWDVTGRGEITTGEFTTSAPKHTVDTHTETSGWSVSLSPAAILGACLAPQSLATPAMLGCLPNVSVQQINGSSSQTNHAPAIIRADDLFIRCDNAVFSGTQIHARLVDAVVTGDLTIETLTNEFRSENTNTGFSACLGAIANLTQDVKPDASISQNPTLGAVPHIRIANEEALSKKIGELASMVGTERFYLTVGGLLYKKSAQVGLKPDGVVVHNPDERIQAGRILEEKVQEVESHERHVFNPAISEFVGMMNQVNELQQTNAILAEIERQQMLDNVPKEVRRETTLKVRESVEKEDKEVVKVAEETADIRQKVKEKIGEQELGKLISGKAVSAKTKTAFAKELNGAIDALQTRKAEIEKTPVNGSTEIERNISAASKETQLCIINEQIDQYQQMLFAFSQSTEYQPVTRIKEGFQALSDTFAENFRLANTMDYEQYVAYQKSQMPETLSSNPEVIESIATSYYISRGLTKIGTPIGAFFGKLDDLTGNVVSGFFNKINEYIDSGSAFAEEKMKFHGVKKEVAEGIADTANLSAKIGAFFAPDIVGKLGKVAMATSGVTKFRSTISGAFTKMGTAIDGSTFGMSWADGWAIRGYAFEKYLETIFPGAKLPDRFKAFDFFDRSTGKAISAKTLDTQTLSRTARPELIRYQINGYINKMLDFTDFTLDRFPLDSSMITAKELHLAIPARTSQIHMQQIQHCIDYGAMNGVKVVITKVK